MGSNDLGWAMFVYGQPSVVFLVLLWVTYQYAAMWFQGFVYRGLRKRLKNVRFFECASRGRLSGATRYDQSVLNFAALFLIYDIDLFFFFSETTMVELWTLGQAVILGFCGLALTLGLYYDIWQTKGLWNR